MTVIRGGAKTGLKNAKTWLFSIVNPNLLTSENGLEIPESGRIEFKKKKKPLQMSLGLGPMTPKRSRFEIYNLKMEAIMDELEQGKSEIKFEDPVLQKLEEILRRRFPHGHPGFIPMTIDEMELHSKKNYDYAGGGKPTGNFDRVGKIVGMYPGIDWSKPQNVALFYALKQLDAYLWLESQKRDGAVEGKDARLGDISVYTKIMRLIMGDQKEVD